NMQSSTGNRYPVYFGIKVENNGLTNVVTICPSLSFYNDTKFDTIFLLINNQSIPNNTIIIPKNNKALHLLQQVRDESHRFAITYHRKLRSKNIQASSLDDIAGVGKKRKVALLKEFGTLETIKNASIDDLAKIKGMNQKTAENVYNFYH
ncbi:helix-hairpin-helix domain-containing protein, partial [Methanobrevibacter sp. UBA188]|uniref:helix-hairpin-helix domain-containing protein n=1 Tax=Methanobrevibacter sp. UBA188 TaxID=1915473 RepID=UPI0025EEA9A1